MSVRSVECLKAQAWAITREMNEDILKGFDAWLDYRRASFEYQVSLGETWTHAFEEFMRRLVTLAEKGETVPSVKTLLLLWIEIVDQVFTDVFRSAEYIRIQGRLVNTATAYRLREREIVDAFLKASHLASRSELDEAYRRIYELRKDVKELKKAFQAIKAGALGTPANLPDDTESATTMAQVPSAEQTCRKTSPRSRSSTS